MKRRGFLKMFGIGVATAVVAPKVLMAVKEVDKPIVTGGGLMNQINSQRQTVLYTGELGKKEFENAMLEVFGNRQEPFPLSCLTKDEADI